MTSKNTKNYWSMTEGVFNCLIDEKRTKAFIRAIQNTVRPGDVVVDMGTGSGILAMAAARAGAGKVFAIENDPNNLRTLKETFVSNGVSDTIELIQADATKVVLPVKFDVVVAEMIATALIEELQVPAMNNILQYGNLGSRVVLEQYRISADLVHNRSRYYGFDFEIIRYEYPEDEKLKSRSYSKSIQLAHLDFRNKTEEYVVEKNIEFQVNQDGECNAIRLSGKTYFSDGSTLGGTFAYSYPILLPIAKMRVKKGQLVSAYIKYKISGGMSTLMYKVS